VDSAIPARWPYGSYLFEANGAGNFLTEDISTKGLVRVISRSRYHFDAPNGSLYGNHLFVASSSGNSVTEVGALTRDLQRRRSHGRTLRFSATRSPPAIEWIMPANSSTRRSIAQQ
jgi:hypothetical protein